MKPLSKWDTILKDLEEDEEEKQTTFAMDLATARDIAVTRAESTAIEAPPKQSRNETQKCETVPKANGDQ